MSLAPPGMPWSRQQREWLQALGHDVLVLAMPPSADDFHADSVSAPELSAASLKPAAPDAAARPAAVADSPLLRALAHAAGRAPQDAEFLALLPDLSVLRSPAARRALWPRLRALRKQG